ncbi:hypothetical protein B0H19DRAFT_1233189 [Mycena capillaripes]|nr:hypothetical protein B0H19DRAFT_1233189 [Mycena capillaripes]
MGICSRASMLSLLVFLATAMAQSTTSLATPVYTPVHIHMSPRAIDATVIGSTIGVCLIVVASYFCCCHAPIRAARLAKEAPLKDLENQAQAKKEREDYWAGGVRGSIQKGDIEGNDSVSYGFNKGKGAPRSIISPSGKDFESQLDRTERRDEDKHGSDQSQKEGEFSQSHGRTLDEDVNSTTTQPEAPPNVAATQVDSDHNL